MITTLAMTVAACLGAGEVSTKFIPSGAMRKQGGYVPIRAEMDGSADLVKTAPDGLAAPKYGKLKIGDKTWVFILDEPDGQPAKLYVDTNNDGDLTNDPRTEWKSQSAGELTQHSGSAEVDLGDGQRGALGLYRFDPKDSRRAALKNTLMFYTDYGYELTLQLDGQTFTTFSEPELRRPLWIDRDGNSHRSSKYESIMPGRPFNFTGTTYVLRQEGTKVTLEQAAESLPVAPLPPDLRVGKPALPFEMAALDGATINFPKGYPGKLVMLDFWAT